DERELRQAGPGQHRADLLGVVALDAREIDREDEDRAVEGGAEQEIGEDAEAEIAPEQQPQVEQRPRMSQLDPQEERQRDGGDERQPENEGRAEPIVLVA